MIRSISSYKKETVNLFILNPAEVEKMDPVQINSSSYYPHLHNVTEMDNVSILELPFDMQFNEGHLLGVIGYSVLMLISGVGNISVLVAILRLRSRGRFDRIKLFLLHLAIADLLVTFLMMPMEIGWNITVQWKGGDMACRILSFFRIFGLCLSGFVLICISLDRYFVIVRPLATPEANRRGNLMLSIAWLSSVICSLPQSFIFHLEKHPEFRWYEQCATFNTFPSYGYELAYDFFGFFILYGLPLVMIIFCYSRILYEIYALSRNELATPEHMDFIKRVKVRTTRMSVTIVVTFVICWSPYNVMSLWYWFDKESAMEVDPRVQKGLFLFACTNSCFNPLIYGWFHFRPNWDKGESVNNGKHKPLRRENYKMTVALVGEDRKYQHHPDSASGRVIGPNHFPSSPCLHELGNLLRAENANAHPNIAAIGRRSC